MPQQPIIKQFSGVMNLDDNDEVIPSVHHRIAKNGRFRGNGNNMRFEGVEGNREVSFSIPSGDNQCIGGYYDALKQRIFFFNYNSNGSHGIYRYNINTEAVTALLVCGVNSTGDILNFDLDYPIASVNILYTTDGDGDILHWIQRNDEAKSLNIKEAEDNVYGSAWLESYLTVIKPPPQMPIKCTYENDTTVTANNLRNSLFQFAYRYVYSNNEKSVWSTKSIVPLPFQPSGNITANTYTNNSRISLSMSTGGADVSKVELCVRVTTSGITTDWQFVDSFDKTVLSLSDNDIYTYKFYNDGLYNSIDVLETVEIQDWLPRLPNTQELLNGNVLCIGGGTEGYDYVDSDMSIDTTGLSGNPFPYDYNGTLFFATIDGIDSGSQGTTMKVYLYGTGTNTSGVVTTLNNGAAVYKIFAQNSSYAAVGATYTEASTTPTVASVLTAISAALVTNGWTQVSIVGNIATFTYPTAVTLDSSGTYTTGVGYESPTNAATTHFTYPYQSAYTAALMYFSDKGRTNGATITAETSFTLPIDNSATVTPQMIINHRPPIWASYYQVLRTANLTYSYRLNWVTNGAYSDASANILGVRYAYLEIDNINNYNELIKSTQGIVGYSFTAGDRVRITGRYNANGSAATLNSVYDYEVLGTVNSYVLNGLTKVGTFLQIYYPTADIDANFAFDGTGNFLAYQILIYNYAKHSSEETQPYFEFGKCYGIGNAGTANAYHIGCEQTQSVNLATPAKVTIANGDFFSRKRVVPIGQTGIIANTGKGNGFYYFRPAATITTITNSLYTIHSAPEAQSNTPLVASYDPAENFFLNNSATDSVTVRIRAKIPVTVDLALNTSVFANISTTGPVQQLITLVSPIGMSPSVGYVVEVDSYVTVPPSGYLSLLIINSANVVNQNVGSFDITLDVITNVTINIIENSFSDNYKIITNSNGRPSLVDVDAKEAINGNLVRWSLPYIQNTNINGSNTFRFTNFDETVRSRGIIQRFKVRDKILRVFQQSGVGNYGIYGKYIKNNSGQNELIVTDQILTKDNIQYYQGEYGMGEEYCGLASSENADYVTYPITGTQIRLAGDGMTDLSETYFGRFDISNLLNKYNRTYLRDDGSISKVIGFFNNYEEEFVNILQGGSFEGETIDNYCFSFNEKRKGFSSFFDYLNPDWMLCAENTVYGWKNGRLYVHDNTVNYTNFFGTQYYPSIKLVYNEQIGVKKNFLNLAYQSNRIWTAPEAGDIYTSMIDGQTQLQQISKLPSWAVEIDENKRVASLLRDINSMSNPQQALIEGNFLQGFNLVINLSYIGSEFSWIYMPYLMWSLNNKQF